MRLRRFVAALTAATVLASTMPAFAQADANVTVVLKSGAKYRGELVEEVPNDHVTIKLATGEVKRFAWDEVDHAPQQVVVPVPAPAPAAAVPEPAGPIVVIESKQPLFLEKAYARGDVVCSAPCDMRVAPGQYRLVGTGFRSSAPFSLGGNSTLKVEASLGESGPYTLGMVTGFVGLGVGVGSLIYAATLEPQMTCTATFSTSGSFESVDRCEKDTSERDVFLIVAGVAAVASIFGFVFAASNRNTVKVDGREIGSRKAGPTVALTPRGIVF